MAGRAVPPVLRFLRALAPDAPGPDAPPDALLLAAFLRRGDQDAFASLLRRHGPMVWGVCRRALPDVHSAEDAFQATFLVFLRKAGSLSRPERLANWLYGVACRTAAKARTLHARRRQRERAPDVEDLVEVPPPEARDLRPVLDEALAGLPEKYRAPLVLCYLEGKTYGEAAQTLGWAEGTVSGRLARARAVLRRRLARTGVALPAAGLAALLTPEALASAPPAGVASSTLSAALRVAAGESGAVSPQVLALTRGVLHAMFLSKLPFAGVVLLTLAFAGAGASLTHRALARPADDARAERAPEPARPAPKDAVEPPPREKPAEAKPPTATSPDGKVKATGDGKSIRLFDVATGKELARMLGHADKVSALAFSPDGKVLASGGLDRTVGVWDVATGRMLMKIRARGPVTALTYSPDGRTLTAREGAKGKRAWDVTTGKELP